MAITIRLLMVYSLADQKLIQSEPFDNASDAMTAYVEAEREHYKTDDIEIVLVAADSIETIRTTHSSYFTGDVTVDQLDIDALLAAG